MRKDIDQIWMVYNNRFVSNFNPYILTHKMTTLEDKVIWEKAEEEEEDLGADIMKSSTDDIINRTRLLENDIKVNFHFFFRKIF
jgi:hypothetical protein